MYMKCAPNNTVMLLHVYFFSGRNCAVADGSVLDCGAEECW